MTGTYFESFLVGGLGLLVAAGLAIAWLLWRQDDTRREAIKLSLEGIGHEFRFNMFQAVGELADVSEGRIRLARDLPDLAHPQLDAVLAEVMAADKRPLAAVQATYQSLATSRRRLRYTMDTGEGIDEALEQAKATAVNAISTLYLWENHEGRPPARARSTRSWWVRDWMKAHGFHQALLPGLYLRDAVVEDLRGAGMVLTPKPLALSAHEYYSRRYDRQADPRGVFGKRRNLRTDEPDAEEAAGEEEAQAEAPARPELAPAPVAADEAHVSHQPPEASPEPAEHRNGAASGETAQDAGTPDGAATEPERQGYVPFGKADNTEADPAQADPDGREGTEQGSGR